MSFDKSLRPWITLLAVVAAILVVDLFFVKAFTTPTSQTQRKPTMMYAGLYKVKGAAVGGALRQMETPTSPQAMTAPQAQASAQAAEAAQPTSTVANAVLIVMCNQAVGLYTTDTEGGVHQEDLDGKTKIELQKYLQGILNNKGKVYAANVGCPTDASKDTTVL